MMKCKSVAGAISGLSLLAVPSVVAAQSWAPGSEIVGQSAQVTTNGVVNTVYFDQGGAARIVSPGGSTVNGTWSAANGQLCLNNGAASECWPYANAFQAGVPLTLVSTCNNSSTWVANGVNAPPPPMQSREGERG
ncbi:MAG TPA: hypothetical protein VFK50_01445 [Sphingomicrobium sp.]|nr:hypothetical protein [Sphingomicrobium sp.]